MKDVVLDSNVIIPDWLLTAKHFHSLLDLARRLELMVLVPEVVVLEVVNKYREELRATVAACEKASARARKLGIAHPDRIVDMDKAVDDYEAELRKGLLMHVSESLRYPMCPMRRCCLQHSRGAPRLERMTAATAMHSFGRQYGRPSRRTYTSLQTIASSTQRTGVASLRGLAAATSAPVSLHLSLGDMVKSHIAESEDGVRAITDYVRDHSEETRAVGRSLEEGGSVRGERKRRRPV